MSDKQLIEFALLAAFTEMLTDLSDGKVIIEESRGHRPPSPYVTIKVLSWGTDPGNAVDWHNHTIAPLAPNLPRSTPRGYREATVSLNAYGDDAIGWIEDFPQFARNNPEAVLGMRDAGVSIGHPVGNVTNVSALLDTSFESRANRTLILTYERTGTPLDVEEFEVLDVSTEFDSPSAAESLTMSGTIDPDNPPC